MAKTFNKTSPPSSDIISYDLTLLLYCLDLGFSWKKYWVFVSQVNWQKVPNRRHSDGVFRSLQYLFFLPACTLTTSSWPQSDHTSWRNFGKLFYAPLKHLVKGQLNALKHNISHVRIIDYAWHYLYWISGGFLWCENSGDSLTLTYPFSGTNWNHHSGIDCQYRRTIQAETMVNLLLRCVPFRHRC
jgi:hypothetical protein